MGDRCAGSNPNHHRSNQNGRRYPHHTTQPSPAMRASMSLAVRVLARQAAIRDVNLALQRQGRRKV